MAAYRRRPDGIPEILRPDQPSSARSAVTRVFSALTLALVPVAALAVLLSVGMPLVVVTILAVLAWLTWLGMREPAATADPPVLRLAAAAQRRSARSGTRAP